MKVTGDIRYVGVNDHEIDLFEGLYRVEKGMAYNSYVILDEKIAVLDTVDEVCGDAWMENLQRVLGNRNPDYLIVQHMEPDHSANVLRFLQKYSNAIVVASFRAFQMMQHYFGTDFKDRRIEIEEGDMLSLGKHELVFISGFMIHWPEVMMTYDRTDKVFFSADAFGKFGAIDCEEDWAKEARRYYIGIVGKYGAQVQALLKKVASWDIQIICPLHGPVLSEDLQYYLGLYDKWSSYEPEDSGILIVYASVYGNTKRAANLFAEKIRMKGCKHVVIRDLVRCDLSPVVAEAFLYGTLVIAAPTYNSEIFPPVREFLQWLQERNYCNRNVAIIENGSWAPMVAMKIRTALSKCKNIGFAENTVRIMGTLSEENMAQIEMLAEELCETE